MTAIAVPLGGRARLPGGAHRPAGERAVIEPALLVPIVLVADRDRRSATWLPSARSGFASLAVKRLIGFVPWNLYSLTGA